MSNDSGNRLPLYAHILLPILRVILMLTIFMKERDYKFAAAAVVVLLIIFAGFAIGILSK